MKKFLVLSCIIFITYASTAQHTSYPTDKMYAYEYNGQTILTKAERIAGLTYKVELMRIPFYDEKDPGLEQFKKHGNLNVEYWINKEEYVLLLGPFHSEEQALKIKDALSKNGYKETKIIDYRDGLRF